MTPSDEQGPDAHGRFPMRRSKQEFLGILRRAGYPAETLRGVEQELGDPIDYDRDAEALARYEISPGFLEDRFGASP